GPNGAGKTTTFYMIVGLLHPNEGRILLEGKDLTDEPVYRRARLGLGYLAQEPSIFRRLTVRENVMAVLETLPLTKAERERPAGERVEGLKLTHRAGGRGGRRLGGGRRRGGGSRAPLGRRSFAAT